jgi:hypothetical protein
VRRVDEHEIFVGADIAERTPTRGGRGAATNEEADGAQ